MHAEVLCCYLQCEWETVDGKDIRRTPLLERGLGSHIEAAATAGRLVLVSVQTIKFGLNGACDSGCVHSWND